MNGSDDVATKPFVSVIMNCFNGQAYLKEAIDSVITQTFTNWELVFWDNQSTDDSAIVFKQYDDPRLKYFYADNHTKLGEARNYAVSKASAEWIAFLDCDDVWIKTKLERQIAIILDKNEQIGLVYTNTQYFSSNGKLNSLITRKDLPSGDIFSELVKDNFIALSSALVNKDIFYKLGGIDSTFNQAEEYNLFVKIAYEYEIHAVSDFLTMYRVHNKNLSFKQKDLTFIESIKTLEIFYSDQRVKQGLRYWSSFYLIVSLARGFTDKLVFFYFIKYGSVLELFRLIFKLSKYTLRKQLT